MSNAFLRLHDYAIGCGLLECMPEVGRQLRETTQKFLALARKSTDDDFQDDDHSGSRDSDSQPVTTSRLERKSTSPEVVPRTEAPPPQRQLFGGLIISDEQVSLIDLTSSETPSGMTSIAEPNPAANYEVITYPTIDNASFPFGFASDFSFTDTDLATPPAQADFSNSATVHGFSPQPTQTDFPSQATQPDFQDLNLTPSLYPSLPLPYSYAAQEVTFGRRLQRSAIQRAYTLVTMPNPPQKRFSRAFGFCLLFEPLDSIRTRLRRALDRTTAESLNNWQYPFLQLGGSTTHFDTANTTTTAVTSASPSSSTSPPTPHRFGNQGTTDVMRTRQANGFSMGPFDARTTAARDMLDAGQQYLPPGAAGFGAEYFDCDEVEMYLHQRGVVIPPAADFVTVEIEAEAFAEGTKGVVVGSEQQQQQQQAGAVAGAGSVDPMDTFTRQSSAGSGLGSGSGDRRSNGVMSTSGTTSAGDTALAMMPGSGGDFSSTTMWRFDGVGEGFVRSAKKQVIVDVNLLIFGMCCYILTVHTLDGQRVLTAADMVERAICLGRSPGLRQRDINKAFWTATKFNS
jgi:hypothetical protein